MKTPSIYSDSERYCANCITCLKDGELGVETLPLGVGIDLERSLISPPNSKPVTGVLIDLKNLQQTYFAAKQNYLTLPTNMDSNLMLTVARGEYTIAQTQYENACVDYVDILLNNVGME